MNVVRFVLTHPLNRARPLAALGRLTSWQIRSRLYPGKIAVPFVGGTKLLVARGMTGATGNVYCGLHEVHDMGFVLHALRPGDLFVDVGANVGSYTVLAGGAAGAEVICFEPLPATFAHLQDNIAANHLGARVQARRQALGAAAGKLAFTTGLDTMNHVATAGEQGVEVEVVRLDDALAGRAPAVMKIDVEGFETDVIAGAEATLANPSLLAVVMELAGAGARYGFDELALHHRMLSFGFATYAYDAMARALRPGGGHGGNMLYVRDLAAVRHRIATARRFRLVNGDI